MKSQFLRWAVGSAVRTLYRDRTVTRCGDGGAPFRFRPGENPVLLRGPARVNTRLKRRWGAVLRAGETIFDIGANIGFTVQRFHALLRGDCRIVAFEPMPRNLELLRANVRALRSNSIEIVGSAVGNETGTTIFRENEEHGSLSRMSAATDEAQGRHELYWRSFKETAVEVVTLDAFVAAHDDLRPTFLKIDVEGAGGMVLEGGRATLERLKPAMDCEFHGKIESAAMLGILRELGYRGVSFDGDGGLQWVEPTEATTVFIHPDDPRAATLPLSHGRSVIAE